MAVSPEYSPSGAEGRLAMTSVDADALANAGCCRLGEAVVEFSALRIERGGDSQRLSPKAMAVLLVLVEQAGRTLSRDHIMGRVWAGAYPLQDVLSNAIKELRRALGDRLPAPRCIQTVPRVGYRLAVDVVWLPASETPTRISVASGDAEPARAPSPPSPAAWSRGPGQGAWRWGALLLLLLLAITAGGWFIAPADEPPLAAPERVIDRPMLLTAGDLPRMEPALAPDGRRFAYIERDPEAGRRLVLAYVDGRERRVAELPAGAMVALPQWSRGGDRIAFQQVVDQRCRIQVARVVGLVLQPASEFGPCAERILEHVEWAHDDSGLWLVQPTSAASEATQLVFRDSRGRERPLDYQRSAGDFDRDPRQSPDGRWIAFRRGINPGADLFLVASSGGAVTRLSPETAFISRFDWYPDSRHLLVPRRDRGRVRLFKVAVDGSGWQDLGRYGALNVDIAETAAAAVYELVWLTQHLDQLDLTVDAGAPQALAPSLDNDSEAAYSPDGARIAFVSDRLGRPQVWLAGAAGGEVQRVSEFAADQIPLLRWVPGGQRLLLQAENSGEDPQWCWLDLETGLPTIAQCQTPALAGVRDVVFLGDPRRLAVLAGDAGRWQVHLIDLPAGGSTALHLPQIAQLAPNLQADGESLYLTDSGTRRILRLDPPYTTPQVVADALSPWVEETWRYADGAAWYLWQQPDSTANALFRQPLQPGAALEVRHRFGELAITPRLVIAADGRRLLLFRRELRRANIAHMALQ